MKTSFLRLVTSFIVFVVFTLVTSLIFEGIRRGLDTRVILTNDVSVYNLSLLVGVWVLLLIASMFCVINYGYEFFKELDSNRDIYIDR